MRTPLIAGNWKMHLAPTEARKYAIRLRVRLADVRGRDILVFPPFTALPAVIEELGRSGIACGGQNLHWEKQGAFTGEISAPFLADLGCSHVLVGHSERRHIFGETDEDCGRKTRAALDAGLTPILCVGETLEQREADATRQVIERQLAAGLKPVQEDEKFVLAYEPVWAIGTGRTASPEQADEVHRHIRAWLGSRFTPDLAARVRILYGGSVKPENVDDLMKLPDLDGVLVGGAALNADSFDRIVRFLP
ncbi:MAG TPA: triose-phosphate isomerase [candidate division WOR-3 bacterium]|uniref:Triosephosphate isomerase n=1 Tax=candidate division WOR-3 bacterium TaxID=2052148 RepID=A0A7V0XFP4_UNCW3|nr:triose-phosphate isomerase [candidate division WOR-3 bacterium]